MMIETLLSFGMFVGIPNMESTNINLMRNVNQSQTNNSINLIDVNEMSEAKIDSVFDFFANLMQASKKENERKYLEAEELYKKALDLHEVLNLPEIMSVDIHAGLGFVYDKLKNREELLKHYSIAYELEPCNPKNMNNLAYAFAVNDTALIQALDLAEISARLMPETGNCYGTLGLVHLKMKQYKDAELNFLKAIELTPAENKIDLGYNYFFLGETYEKINQQEKAYDCFLKAKKLGFAQNDE